MKPLNVLLRADASTTQGTGHVMRCLTLTEELLSRGHNVELWSHIEGVPWLSAEVERSGVFYSSHPAHSLDVGRIRASGFDCVVVDSYEIPASEISKLNAACPVLAIVDADYRGVDAALYLDQNLGTEIAFPETTLPRNLLLGSNFSLVRDGFLRHRRSDKSPTIEGKAHVVVFFGGSDPHGTVVSAAQSILRDNPEVSLTVICAKRWITKVEEACLGAEARVLEATPDLPHFLAEADIIVSAAGTSAWDICTLGRAAVFVAVVDNQLPSLKQIRKQRVALTLDATGTRNDSLGDVGVLVSRLVESESARRALLARCALIFDGKGKSRVVDRMEEAFGK